MRLPTRRNDDADVIRARLRILLHEAGASRGWLPDDSLPDDGLPDDDPPAGGPSVPGPHPYAGPGPGQGPGPGPDEDPVVTTPLHPVRLPVPARDGEPPDGEPDGDGAGLPSGIGRHRAPGAAVRLAPGRRSVWALWAAGLLAVLLLIGWTWLHRPRVEPVPERTSTSTSTATRGTGRTPATPSVGATAATSATVVVSVVGLVAHPGLVTLSAGSRVADAVAAAGGLLPEADPASVNLAAVVSDGEQLSVGATPGPAAPGGAAAASGGPLDLNTATAEQLDALPGIGPVLAQRIVAYRQRQGRFTSVEQLQDVPGIGPAIYAELADLVRV